MLRCGACWDARGSIVSCCVVSCRGLGFGLPAGDPLNIDCSRPGTCKSRPGTLVFIAFILLMDVALTWLFINETKRTQRTLLSFGYAQSRTLQVRCLCPSSTRSSMLWLVFLAHFVGSWFLLDWFVWLGLCQPRPGHVSFFYEPHSDSDRRFASFGSRLRLVPAAGVFLAQH